MSMPIQQVPGAMLSQRIDAFVALSQRVVEAGSHLGWESASDADVIRTYWNRQCSSIDDANHVLFALWLDGELVGTVQYERGHFPTSRHRAEVAKLMVAPAHRRRGIASLLMEHLESHAKANGVELLVLDTRAGEPVEDLYLRRGYTRTGFVPNWMKYESGAYRDTVFFYKDLR